MPTEEKIKSKDKSGKKFAWAAWALMAIIVAVSLVVGVIDNDEPLTAGERASSISRTIRCPQCDGETVAESNAPIAQEIRADIRRRVSEGQTDDEIRNFMASLYGQDILLIPPSSGIGGSIWIIPIVGLFVAFGILGAVFWRWRGELKLEDEASFEDIELVKTAQDQKQREQTQQEKSQE